MTEFSSIDALLVNEGGRLGEVSRCLLGEGQAPTSDPAEIVRRGAAANTGAAYNMLTNVAAIREGKIPASPSRANRVLSSARAFLKRNGDSLHPDDRSRLEGVLVRLLDAVEDDEEQDRETKILQSDSADLEAELEQGGGVYVYTYPHYLRHPTIEGTERTLLKIGMSDGDPEKRVTEQVKGAWVPESPIVLRVIRHPERTPSELETSFHRLLDAADHDRSDPKRAGRDWFHTSLEFIDEVAHQLGCSVSSRRSSL